MPYGFRLFDFWIFFPFLFSLCFSFCCSDWPSTGLSWGWKMSKEESSRRPIFTMKQLGVVAGNLALWFLLLSDTCNYNINVHVCLHGIEVRWDTVFCVRKSWISILKDSIFLAVSFLKFWRWLCENQGLENFVLVSLGGPKGVWENFCSPYHNKCLRLANERFVLASGSSLSLATGLARWKVSLEPCCNQSVIRYF